MFFIWPNAEADHDYNSTVALLPQAGLRFEATHSKYSLVQGVEGKSQRKGPGRVPTAPMSPPA